jgi:glycosyltransferase involved in cell wall biosynthesis
MLDDTGRIVPPRDPMALAAALRELLEMPADRRRALGEAARRRAVAEFSIQRVAAAYEAMYRSLVN